MANYSSLKSTVESVVRTNGEGAITGANLQSTLKTMIDSLGAKYQIVGVATASTNPGTPDYNVAYVAVSGSSTVTFTNFQNSGTPLTLAANKLGILKYNGSWTIESADIPSGGGGSSAQVDILNVGSFSTAGGNSGARASVDSSLRKTGFILVYYDTTLGRWRIEQFYKSNVTASNWTADVSWKDLGERYYVNLNQLTGSFNPYASASAARQSIPTNMRFPGLVVTYLLSMPDNTSQLVIEAFDGPVSVWSTSDDYWRTIYPSSCMMNVGRQPDSTYATNAVPSVCRRYGFIITYYDQLNSVWETRQFILDPDPDNPMFTDTDWNNPANWHGLYP